jgi:AraC family transcriptional regulator of adaptative response/methylated-DNA-[protein]-cysteine methyltransferase
MKQGDDGRAGFSGDAAIIGRRRISCRLFLSYAHSDGGASTWNWDGAFVLMEDVAKSEPLRYAFWDSFAGPCLVATVGEDWVFCGFPHEADGLLQYTSRRHRCCRVIQDDALEEQGRALIDGGQSLHLMQWPLQLAGSGFQIRVWLELLSLRSGETLSYGDLAARIQHPRAVRACASAVGANPLSLVLPCHRVVRRDGRPGGFRWGLLCRERLLARERGLVR